MTAGTRLRAVTDQDGERHTGAIVLAPDEAASYLHVEADLHERAGWSVVRFERAIVCLRGGVTRRIWLRTLNPMEDS